jgi:hypothetical protein
VGRGPDNWVRGRDTRRTDIRCDADRRTHPKVVLAGLLSDLAFYIIVDRDLTLRDRPNVP